jgi:hypothetical protein
LLFNPFWSSRPKPTPTPHPSPSAPTRPSAGPAGWYATAKTWLVEFWAAWWPWLLFGSLLTAATGIGVYRLRRWLHRRAVLAGTWVEVIPPRQVNPGYSAVAWRLLDSLVVRADNGWHLAKPPLAVEIHGDGGRLSLAIWVPRWLTVDAVTTEVRIIWPGARVQPFTPPAGGRDWKAAGYRMVPVDTDLGPLVDDNRGRSRTGAADADPLRPVLDALRRNGGPMVLQVLAKPAKDKLINKLLAAARRPAKPRRSLAIKAVNLLVSVLVDVLREVLDALTPGPKHRSGHTAASSASYQPPDALQRKAMTAAGDKLAEGPHMLVAIRAMAVRPTRGHAVADARTVAHAYSAVSRLRPRRLRRALSKVTERYAHHGEWMLASSTEMGSLMHLPGDPARYGFRTAAVIQPVPLDAVEVEFEHPTDSDPGWSRGRWNLPPGTTKTALAMREHGEGGQRHDPYDDEYTDEFDWDTDL